MFAHYRELIEHGDVVLRYLLPLASDGDKHAENLQAENATHGDLLRVETAEGATRCWRKVILWYRYALRAWPAVRYLGVADDDVYIAFGRLAVDLASLSAARQPAAAARGTDRVGVMDEYTAFVDRNGGSGGDA